MKDFRLFLILILLHLMPINAMAQSKLVRDFRPICDSLSVLVRERTGVEVELRMKTITQRENSLDFYFSQTLSDVPWREDDVEWFRESLKNLFPENLAHCSVGRIFGNNLNINTFIVPELHYDGTVHSSTHKKVAPSGNMLVERIGGQKFPKGLSGRHIALWQSHGRYYEEQTKRWEWQRAQTFMTVEDMYTQSFVIPFLIPMLENAGAYVMTPRERDTQRHESVVDNDPSFDSERTGLTRRSGQYEESGDWKPAGVGFADKKALYIKNDNPFKMGTARQCSIQKEGKELSVAQWTPEIAQRGKYAVYVSYKTLPNSSSYAHYSVKHMGGVSEFAVNQKMGGGTWIYLGTFEFEPDKGHCVTLDNSVPEEKRNPQENIITADAVRFGGGMGKIARGTEDMDEDEWASSGLPSYTEGALYSMQWAGIDSTIIRKHPDDYTNDFADRGPWVSMMSGGSVVNPKEEGKGIPFDLSFAFHSDAGVFPNDSIVGTLTIYTLKNEGSRKLPDGGDRMMCRDLCNYVQTQVVNDIRSKYEPEWARREIWDRSYSEARTSNVPGMILELMSHQNFADMKYGHDPAFKFDVSRAAYKGILKFMSDRYGIPYEVQPLPISNFAAIAGNDNKVRLSWKPTIDTLEQTAVSKGYILYTRIDGGAFDEGRIVDAVEISGRMQTSVEIVPGHIYSYKVVAYNDGGKSFPSEILSVGIPENPKSDKKVLAVNNFYRVSAPAWFDTPEYAGFDFKSDRGVPYLYDISYIGEMYQFRRELEWVDDENPGFGASYTDEAGFQAAGNSFDYPYIHGKAILGNGYAFSSMGSDTFASDSTLRRGFWAMDLICGKQVSTSMGRGAVEDRYEVFPTELQEAIKKFTSRGGNVIISGSNIGTDVWDKVYPVKKDSLFTLSSKRFVENVLGYRWITNYASRSGLVKTMPGKKDIDTSPSSPTFSFYTEANEKTYCVETPDGILPADKNGTTFLRYADTDISAAVCSDQDIYKTISYGFPLEVLIDESDIERLFRLSFAYFEKK